MAENEPDPEAQLDQLQENIEAVRRQAQEHGTLPTDEHKPTLIDPDGDGDPDEAPGIIGGL
jgi:hypothetical protein